jgi:hypothetical protein
MMTEHLIQPNLFSGHPLVFSNQRSDWVKVLCWDRDGWAIWYPLAGGLEAGTFQLPIAEAGRKEIAAWEQAALLEGIDLSRGRRRKRYSPPTAMPPEASKEEGGEGRVP